MIITVNCCRIYNNTTTAAAAAAAADDDDDDDDEEEEEEEEEDAHEVKSDAVHQPLSAVCRFPFTA